ncbi:hypothetical protein [Clostridium beijerinckii]|uniref:hypothetical protein n=1 Tax=Clostridium beijerinckii TaxID=1520 RepID=UPI000479AF74|nr:hypothetical protein [Clostridium beijerinckii]
MFLVNKYISLDIVFTQGHSLIQYKDGFVDLPTKPGLGLIIDENKVKEVAMEGLNWSNPNWKNYDGTKAEW